MHELITLKERFKLIVISGVTCTADVNLDIYLIWGRKFTREKFTDFFIQWTLENKPFSRK